LPFSPSSRANASAAAAFLRGADQAQWHGVGRLAVAIVGASPVKERPVERGPDGGGLSSYFPHLAIQNPPSSNQHILVMTACMMPKK
jgi:hypothetical protein